MNILKVRNVHHALPIAVSILKELDYKRESRNGTVYLSDSPVTTVYEKPTERVLFWSERDANPFFHFFEALWMLGGRRDVASMTRFVKNFGNYSDDGEIFWGAYGYRWRVGMPHPGGGSLVNVDDQLKTIVERLKQDKNDRRCVLQMWNSFSDLGNPSKDVPCNTTATFQVGRDGELNLVVFNRSNDIIWGCYGANAVQFSFLLEYVASAVGIPVGTYSQISVNWHGYEKTLLPLHAKFISATDDGELSSLAEADCPYTTGQVKPFPLFSTGTIQDLWDADLRQLLKYNGRGPGGDLRWNDEFFPKVAIPLLRAHDCFKSETDNRFVRAFEELEKCAATDWKLACNEWLVRRQINVG